MVLEGEETQLLLGVKNYGNLNKQQGFVVMEGEVEVGGRCWWRERERDHFAISREREGLMINIILIPDN